MSIKWYTLAANRGDTEAQRDLGYSYFYGEGVNRIIKRRSIGTGRLLQKMIQRLCTISAFAMQMAMACGSLSIGPRIIL